MLDVQKIGTTTTVKPLKDLVSQASTGFLSAIKGLDLTQSKTLVVDFCLVTLIDSMGLGALIATYNALKAQGQSIKVIKIHPEVFGLMKNMGLDRHFDILPL